MIREDLGQEERRTAPGRGGYAVAIAVNLVLLYLLHGFWDVIPFVTGDFARVLWPITFSIVATLLVNAAYLFFDPPWFKSLTSVGLSAISLAVTIRVYQVFPFEFPPGFDWAIVARILLWVAMIGTGIAIVVETTKFISWMVRWMNGTGAAAGRT